MALPGIATPHDPMNEMYEFFAFGEALDDGLSADALVEQRAAQGRANLANRVHELITQLTELIDVNEREREQLVTEARGLTPREAQEYCDQLTQRVDELKQTVTKQQRDFDKAEKEIREQKEQNATLVASIVYLRNSLQRNKDNQARFQGQLYAAGAGLCQTIANPSHSQRNGNDSGKYPRGSTSPGSGGI